MSKLLNLFGPSWRVKLGGLAAVIAAVAHVLDALANGKPVEWELTAIGIANGWALMFARDNKVTSEDVGAK
jgi:hypothetical protein